MSSTFEQLFQLSQALLAMLDARGRFVELNPAWERTLGWTLDELRAMQPLELVHPEDRETTVSAGAGLLGGTGRIQLENRYRCKDGRYKWLVWQSQVQADAGDEPRRYFVTAVDVTPYKEALREREEAVAQLHLFKAMLENTPDQVGIIDLEGRVRYRNPAAMRHIGPGGRDGDHVTAAQVHSSAFQEKIEREVTPALQTTGVWSGEGDLLRADGTVMPTYQILVALRDAHGDLAAYGTLIRDMTAEKQLELQLRGAVQALATPTIPISDRVLVMPLIGLMDGDRAAQITRAALEGVHGRGVEVLILDVTGLQNIDTQVSGALLHTARALGLLGVRTMLTGIQPSVAQALVGLGLDLSAVETASTLQRAISLALSGGGRVHGLG